MYIGDMFCNLAKLSAGIKYLALLIVEDIIGLKFECKAIPFARSPIDKYLLPIKNFEVLRLLDAYEFEFVSIWVIRFWSGDIKIIFSNFSEILLIILVKIFSLFSQVISFKLIFIDSFKNVLSLEVIIHDLYFLFILRLILSLYKSLIDLYVSKLSLFLKSNISFKSDISSLFK